MRSLHSVQRRTGFETLEAKKLFAADFIGATAVDLTDAAIASETSHDWENPSNGQTCLWNTVLGGQEGEPINKESAPVASIAPDGCVDLIKGTTMNSPDTAIGAEIDMPMVAENLTILNTVEAGLTETWRPSATGAEHQFGNPVNSLKSKTSEAMTNVTDNGLDSSDLVADIHGDPYFAVDALYQRNELELATNLGGQEGEDFSLDLGDAVSGVAAVHTSGVVDSLASSKTSESLHDNTNNAISMVNTAEGGLDGISEAIIRMRELAVQSANGDFQVTDQHYFAVR